jgi:hypothetical protein
MTLREEALKLADDIAEYAPDTNIEIMIRRLVAVMSNPAMSHEEAELLIDTHTNAPFALLRAVERHHGVE